MVFEQLVKATAQETSLEMEQMQLHRRTAALDEKMNLGDATCATDPFDACVSNEFTVFDTSLVDLECDELACSRRDGDSPH